jgi:hypothetical protein
MEASWVAVNLPPLTLSIGSLTAPIREPTRTGCTRQSRAARRRGQDREGLRRRHEATAVPPFPRESLETDRPHTTLRPGESCDGRPGGDREPGSAPAEASSIPLDFDPRSCASWITRRGVSIDCARRRRNRLPLETEPLSRSAVARGASPARQSEVFATRGRYSLRSPAGRRTPDARGGAVTKREAAQAAPAEWATAPWKGPENPRGVEDSPRDPERRGRFPRRRRVLTVEGEDRNPFASKRVDERPSCALFLPSVH